ncbi:IS21 family transposase [Alkalicella caledoniensis]|uniref:IS21 family transposase n=1 Tax=Alkalicella caledoniensis TaxID=2731377 RepID=A0A7G9WA40_ALKCA|nr:IS21 family transposase [Alkalicella caledoniensis]QNO15348.1 IS21 family transposase [Alkalicella caledoniensis]QNO15552.1 IS21 family transposase [Alkalicella caledoniensis]QNO15911.1 IS21 family transposase [Alkalicella caledoniensis]
MITLMNKQEIILSNLRDGVSQWEIHRRTGIDRKTIRKYIREYEAKKAELVGNEIEDTTLIEDLVSPPKYKARKPVKRKLTDEIIGEINNYLKENEEKQNTGRRKQQKKKIDIFECLSEKGYDISYSTVCSYIRKVEKESKEAYIRQEYSYGDSTEFDWGYVKLIIGGKPKTFQMGAFANAMGNHRYAHLYHNQKMESFLDVHVRFFKKMNGVHRTVVYDNMKVAVKSFAAKNEKEPTDDLLKLSLYYGFRYRFCNIAKGNEKGRVERSVEYIRRKAFSKRDTFDSLEEANEYLEKELDKLNSKPTKANGGKSPREVLEEEQKHLLSLMPDYDTARTAEYRVSKYSTISIDENKYSVPDHLVGKFVFVKIYPHQIQIYYDQQKIAEHKRSYGNFTWTLNIEHYVNTIKKKPGSLHSSAAIRQMDTKLQKIYHNYYTENPREFIELLEIIGEKGLYPTLKIIERLERISITSVSTEKIKLLINREEEPQTKIIERTTDIIANSKFILNHYGKLLGNNQAAFQKEATII